MNYLRVLYRSFLRNKKVDELEQKLKDKDQQIEKLMLYQIHCQDDNPEYFPIILTENEQNLLIKYLKRSKIYLEYGSGGSTFLALKESETKIFSVESDANWIKYLSSWKIVKNALEQDSLKFLHADIGPVQVFGYPLNRDNEEVFYKYSSLFFNSYSEIKPDTIFIDRIVFQPLDKNRPCLAVEQPFHLIRFGIPIVEIPDHGNFYGMRSPDAEAVSVLPVFF